MHVESSWAKTREWSAKAKGQRSLQTPPKPLGYGHPLYPLGDPRGRWLLEQLPRNLARERLVTAVHERTGLHPSLDFALVELSRAIAAPSGAPFAILAIGRCVGWLAHYFEHLQGGALIRPRAAYVGPLPSKPIPAPRGRVIKAR
jgi:citrate synthase